MGQLSGQGVKLVLPALLKGVEDKAWRTKQGSIQVGGRAGRQRSLLRTRSDKEQPCAGSNQRDTCCQPGFVSKRAVLQALAQVARIQARPSRLHARCLQLLGAMAHCAPKQLGSCLPVVVPRLGDVLADPHPKVASAARTALNEVGSVIRNPEVAKLVPVLLAGERQGRAGFGEGGSVQGPGSEGLPAYATLGPFPWLATGHVM